ncbi:MAG: hypothetical protein HFF37_00015 [Coprobacillus sp.]|nr:hypothetical protein [Coprobacillus sp.]
MGKLKKFLFGTLIGTVIIGASPSYVYASEVINAKVEARYSSNRISWNKVGNHDRYNVYRVGDDDTKLSLIATVDGLEYIDNDSGVNTQERYVIKCTNDESIQSSVVKDSYKTGIEAVQGHATAEVNNFHVSLLGGNEKFDGTKVLSFSQNINRLQEIKQGTVLISFRPDKEKIVNNREILLNVKDRNAVTPSDNYLTGSPNPANCISFMQGDTNVLRYDIGSNLVRYNVGNAVAEDGWTTYGLTAYTEGTTSYFKNRVNGKQESNYNHSGNYLHNFLNNSAITNLNFLTIGGAINNGVNKAGFKGEIAYVTITDEVMSESEVEAYTVAVTNKLNKMDISLGSQISNMFNDDVDNTWLFVGGEEVQGSYNQVQGMRNYVSHFEEYIRWTQSSNTTAGKQRFVMNAGKKGQTLNDIINKFDSYKNEFNPKAMAYMIGKEDYSQDDVNRFKEELREFITLSLELRNQQGFAVIQKPHTIGNVDTDAIIEKYCGVVDEVVEEFTNANNDQRIVVVEHDVTDESLKDGMLNQKGHYNIGQQLSEATIKTTSHFPCTVGVNFNLKNMNKVEEYVQDIKPIIQSTDNSLEVEIPTYKDIQEWSYVLTLDDKTITDIVGNEFVISPLEKGSKYSIKIQSKDGKVQIRTMSGVVGEGQNASVKTQSLDSLQEQLKNKMDSDDSLTWLFMGDSITHGSAYSLGQDTIAQSFEKYLRDDLKRTNDIVVNTAVSGATIDVSGSSTLATINERLNSYSPDIVSIMLGTNDSTALSVEQYRAQLQTLINKAKAKTDIVVLRSPLPTQWDRDARCREYTQVMKEVASEMDCIFIDQYTPFHNVVGKYPYMYQDQYFVYGDNCVFGQGKALHPGANGHLMMTKQFIEGIGILDEDTFIPNLFIKMPFSDREDTTTNLTFGKTLNSISFDTEQLSGVKDIKLTVQAGTKKYEVSGDSGILKLENLPSHQVYKVSVSGCSTSQPQLISYTAQNIELVDKTELNNLIQKYDEKDLSIYTDNSKNVFEKALNDAKDINVKLDSTIKEVDEALASLKDAIEQLTVATSMEVELQDNISINDLDELKAIINENDEVQKIIEDASQQGQKIMLKVSLIEKQEEVDLDLSNENEKAFGLYNLQALLMINDKQAYDLKDLNMPFHVEIDIPSELLDEEVESFYLVGGIDGKYQKVDFERNEDSITFNGKIGDQYIFVYEEKVDEVEKPSEDDKKPSLPSEDEEKPTPPSDDENKPSQPTPPTDDNKKPDITIKDDNSDSVESDVLGSEIDNDKTEQKTEGIKQNNKVQTGDQYEPLLYGVMLAVSLAVPFILKKRKGINNEKESNN